MEQYKNMSINEIQKLITNLTLLRNEKQRKVKFTGILKVDIYDSEVYFGEPYVTQSTIELVKLAEAGDIFIYEDFLWKREKDYMVFCSEIENFLDIKKVSDE